MADLILHVRKKYFDRISTGEKIWEYRKETAYWAARLLKNYDAVQIHRGYPKSSDTAKILCFKWYAPHTETITHEFFNYVPTRVFVVDLRERL